MVTQRYDLYGYACRRSKNDQNKARINDDGIIAARLSIQGIGKPAPKHMIDLPREVLVENIIESGPIMSLNRDIYARYLILYATDRAREHSRQLQGRSNSMISLVDGLIGSTTDTGWEDVLRWLTPAIRYVFH